MKGRLAVLTKINEGAMPVLALPLIIRSVMSGTCVSVPRIFETAGLT